MRNVVYAINITLDGCCDHTKFNPDPDDGIPLTLTYHGCPRFVVPGCCFQHRTYHVLMTMT
jgi:hypothetical protein